MYGTELNFKRWILRLFTFLFLNWGGTYGIVVKFSFLLTRISCSRYDSISTLVKYYAIPLLTILSIESGLKFLGIRISSNILYVQNIVMKQVRNENFSSNLKELRTFRGTHGGWILLPHFLRLTMTCIFCSHPHLAIPEGCLRAEVEQFPQQRKSVTAQPRNSKET
jgi:hypothetical protein